MDRAWDMSGEESGAGSNLLMSLPAANCVLLL